MKYRVLDRRNIRFPSGRIEGKGFVFDPVGEYELSEAVLANYVVRKWIAPVDEDAPVKITKEIVDAPVKKRGRPKKSDDG